jgi:cysteine desulfurase
LRSGTLAPALVVGIGEACRLAMNEMGADREHITKLSNRFMNIVNTELTHIFYNGDIT